MIKSLDDAFGVEEAFFTSIHAYTTEQSLIDTPSSVNLRLSRAAVENIVPVDSWTEKGIQRLFPKLAGRFAGCKLNVPVPDSSCVDLVTTLGTLSTGISNPRVAHDSLLKHDHAVRGSVTAFLIALAVSLLLPCQSGC